MRVVLCGSMKVKEKILEVKEQLESLSIDVLLPQECMDGIEKEIASRKHFERIAQEETDAILIVNEEKEGIKNYIGPNSFAEIAFGFYFRKKIYVLNAYYSPYQEELTAWKVVPLYGDLSSIKNELTTL